MYQDLGSVQNSLELIIITFQMEKISASINSQPVTFQTFFYQQYFLNSIIDCLNIKHTERYRREDES